MLKILRDQFKYLSWLLWLVILIFVAFIFVDFGGAIGGGPASAPTQAARVGDDEVTMAEFQSQYRRLEDQFRQLYGERFNPDVARQLRLPVQALDQAIAQKILLIEARDRGLVASDSELRRAVLEIPAFQNADGTFVGKDEYVRMLAQSGQTVASFERALRDDLSMRRLGTALAAAVHVGDAEIERSYREKADRATVRFLLIPGQRFASSIQLADADVAAHFAAEPARFQLPEQRVVDYLLVEAAKLNDQIQPTEEELRAAYGQSIGQFTRQEQVRARHILLRVDEDRDEARALAEINRLRSRIEGGEDFARLATEFSDDPASKARGGDMGFFERGRMLKEFEDAAFSAQEGVLVGPIRTSFGFHLIRVEGRQPGGQTPFEQVRAQVRSRLVSERAQALAETRARELVEKLGSGPISETQMKPLAEASNSTVSFLSTAAFGAQDNIPGIGRAGAFAETAFSSPAGKAAGPVRTARGWAVLAVRQILPPRVPQLDEVRDRVRQSLTLERMQRAALDEAARVKSRLDAGSSLDQEAKALGLEVKDSGPFGSDGFVTGLGASPELARAALALSTGQVGGPISAGQGGVVFEVTDRTRFDPALFATEREGLREQLEQEEFGRLLGSLVERRRQELKVSYNRQVLEQFGVVDETGAVS